MNTSDHVIEVTAVLARLVAMLAAEVQRTAQPGDPGRAAFDASFSECMSEAIALDASIDSILKRRTPDA